MKRTILTLAGLMVLGTTGLMADGSTVNVNKTKVDSQVLNDSKILKNSSVGIDVDAKQKSTVNINKTKVKANLYRAKVINSTVGIDVEAKNKSKVNVNQSTVTSRVSRSTVKNSSVGIDIKAK